jgi:hypothetical protein
MGCCFLDLCEILMDIHGLVFWDLIVIEWDLMGYEYSNIVIFMGFNEYVSP